MVYWISNKMRTQILKSYQVLKSELCKILVTKINSHLKFWLNGNKMIHRVCYKGKIKISLKIFKESLILII